jgi:hypothetical protein
MGDWDIFKTLFSFYPQRLAEIPSILPLDKLFCLAAPCTNLSAGKEKGALFSTPSGVFLFSLPYIFRIAFCNG